MRVDPGQRLRRAAPSASRHEAVDQAELERLARRRTACLRAGRAARAIRPSRRVSLGDAGRAGDQAERDLGQAEAGSSGRRAAKRQWPTSATSQPPPSAAPLRQRDDRLAQRLERAEARLHRLDLGGTPAAASAGFSAARPSGRRRRRTSSWPTRARCRLMRVLVARRPAPRPRSGRACHCAHHGVDRRAGLVEGDGGDAVGVELVADGLHASTSQTRSTIVAMPMPPPTHSVARP